MDAIARIEKALDLAIGRAHSGGCPPRLAAAMEWAVFPRGARVRPRICLAVAAACGDDEPDVADSAAAAIELLHCASLVHDDMPCFDNADTRRGRPTVHRQFGEPLALLAGDALIVLAFQNLSRAAHAPRRLAALLMLITRSVGVPIGIVAGQAWECEPAADVAQYHREKTGSLFAAATMAGAAAAGADPDAWRVLGERIGEAYQVADDLCDAVGCASDAGKPIGRDIALDRPSATRTLGIAGAVQYLDQLVAEGVASIPDVPGARALHSLIMLEAKRLVPKGLKQSVA
jgi:geranylgeranyl diphosphate synthase, type II